MFSRIIFRSLRGNAAISRVPALRPRLPSHLARLPRVPCRSYAQAREKSATQAAKELLEEYPFSFSAAAIAIFLGACSVVYLNYLYIMVYSDQFQDFPEPVAKKLRQGSHYTNVWVNPLKALKCYQQALQEAHNLNMDPHSEQVFRIKMQIAALLEKNQLYHKAIEVLDFVRKDNLKWDELEGCKKGNEAKRRRVMDNTVRISAKLADLYTNSFVMENEAAEELLIWIVTTVTKERKRREAEGPIEGEAKWLSNEEVGAAYEALANHYEKKDLHYLAAPLFLQSIGQVSKSDCHSVILMNNLSISLAQQDPPAQPGIAPVSRAALIASARSWAQQALTKAANITPPDRTSECDIGCAVATHNLGEFAEMEGNLDEARKMYEEARSLARAIRFEEGVENAAEGLRRVLDKKES